MDYQNTVLNLHNQLTDKGHTEVSISLSFKSPGRPEGYCRSEEAPFEFFYGDTMDEVVDALQNHIDTLPSTEDLNKQRFSELFAKLIELGDDIGIDTAPLHEQRKIIWENLLTCDI